MISPFDGFTPTQLLSVVCPFCKAAQTAKCLQPTKDGHKWIDTFHEQRIEAFKQAQKDIRE
jgi:hypothetical protein